MMILKDVLHSVQKSHRILHKILSKYIKELT